MLIKVLCHIFDGTSAAVYGVWKGMRPSKGQIHGITDWQPHSIAYAAIQVLFPLIYFKKRTTTCLTQGYLAISSSNKWTVQMGTFNLQHFFYFIVKLFEHDRKDPWVIKTLDKLNR